MSLIVKGRITVWAGPNHQRVHSIEDADIDVAASRRVGVWLVHGDYDSNGPLRMVVGIPTEQGAARAYAASSKVRGHTVPKVFRVFPLASLEPIELGGVIDDDGDEEWSAFQDAWIEVRL